MGGHFIGAGLAWCYIGKGKKSVKNTFYFLETFLIITLWCITGWNMAHGPFLEEHKSR